MNSHARRFALKLAASALLGLPAFTATAQSVNSHVAVPFYKPEDVVIGLYQHWAQPRANAFAQKANDLNSTLESFCGDASQKPTVSLPAVREKWKAAVNAWEALSAVPIGPLIERRSARAIDFTPTRPPLIKRAIAQAPRGSAAMDRIGSPAKGFPALEWLLWENPIDRGSQSCAYAVEVATEITREASALQKAFGSIDSTQWDTEQYIAALSEFINQWVGSAERLRWKDIERPVREAKSKSRNAASFPRQSSNATPASWATHWSALRDLAMASGNEAPLPGQALVPMEMYLRGLGQVQLATRWRDAIAQADTSMKGLTPGARNKLIPAAKQIASIKRMAEEDIALAFNVSIGFSDNDGD